MEPTTTADQATTHFTRDYDRFKLLFANRNIDENHVKALKKAFDESGNITKVQPILVNENFEIIDGQHRFQAAKELRLPVYYTRVPGLNIHDAQQMNLLHKLWTLSDFVNAYAQRGNQEYIKYQQLQKDYPQMSHSALLALSTYGNPRGMFKMLRTGEFVFEDESRTREQLDKLAELMEFVDFGRDKYFAYAVRRIIRHADYDHTRMVNKMRLFGNTMQRQASVESMLRALEDIYNYRMQEQNRVRLF